MRWIHAEHTKNDFHLNHWQPSPKVILTGQHCNYYMTQIIDISGSIAMWPLIHYSGCSFLILDISAELSQFFLSYFLQNTQCKDVWWEQSQSCKEFLCRGIWWHVLGSIWSPLGHNKGLLSSVWPFLIKRDQIYDWIISHNSAYFLISSWFFLLSQLVQSTT